MIDNWEIASRVDKTGTIHYTVLIDGTEHDARLVAKKLKGYVKEPTRAEAPYVYAFKLPPDLDEGTQDKLHTALREAVELTNKINQFVPGGVLGDPLFNAQTSIEDKAFPTFLTMDPSASIFQGSTPGAQAKPQIDLSFVSQLHVLPGEEPPRAQQISSNEIEQSMSELPQNSTTPQFSTTVREVFMTQPSAPQAPHPPEQQSSAAPVNNKPDAPQKPMADIPATSAKPLVQSPTQPAEPAQDAQPPLSITDEDMLIKDMEGSMLNKMPLEDILSAETKYDIFVDVEKTPLQNQSAQEQKEQKIKQADATGSSTFSVFDVNLKEQTVDMEEVQNLTNNLTGKTMDFTKKPEQPNQQQPAAPTAKSQTDVSQPQQPDQPPTPSQEVPFTLGSSSIQEPKPMLADVSAEGLPEEERLEATVPPQTTEQGAEDLPEITVRGKALDKTFNLETTFNTEVMKRQYEKTLSLRQKRDEEEPHMKTVLRLKKITLTPPNQSLPQQEQANQAQPQEKTQKPEQDEEALGKTILRLRRKGTPAPTNTPQVTPQEAMPQTLHSTRSPQRVAQDIRLARTKNIDHSIQIPVSELKKHNWPLEVPLVPTYTLNNMVMSVNRFAHATAVSVIENPGKLYNPLVLHGGTGTGKTHFLNALAYAFSQKFGQEHIFMTNGVRLSRGIQRYVMEGNIQKFEQFMESVRVLLIDDIHLLAINEQNRTFISKLLNTFVKELKQIVITSKYPPESLEKLEELINFKLSSGWISELKPATGASHFRIVKKMLLENGVDLNDKQIEDFFGAPQMTLGTVTRSIRRLKVLENLIFPNLPTEQKTQAGIFEKLLATRGEDLTSELIDKDPATITSLSTIGNGEWGRIGFFYPQNCSDMMNWMVYALQQRAKELGIEGGFEIVVRSSYATENIISSAFKIANLCDNKKLKGAVILGPKPDACDLSVRENFYDILTHMLEIMLIRCGIINYENVRLPSTYVKVISELMR